MTLVDSAPPPATATPTSPPMAADTATATAVALIDDDSDTVTVRSWPAVARLSTLTMYAATSFSIRLCASAQPIEMASVFSTAHHSATAAAAASAEICDAV